MAAALGDRPMRGERIGPQRELELWEMPTSPAAILAAKQGGTPEEIAQANALWAQQLKQEGATDEQILMECRKFAYERGKLHGKGDPRREFDWHQRMAERSAAKALGQPMQATDGDYGMADGPVGQEGA
jgi:hypothetical protein